MRTFPENNFTALREAMTHHASSDILRLVEDVTNGRRTRAILGKRCIAVAIADIEVIVHDSTPKAVTVEWPVLIGEENQVVFTPISDTSLWVESLMRLPYFAREVDMSDLRKAAKADIIHAIANVDPNNLVVSAMTLMPLAQKMQNGLRVQANVIDLRLIGDVSDSLAHYLRSRCLVRLETSLTTISPQSLMEPDVLAAAAPLISAFTQKKDGEKGGNSGSADGMSLLKGVLSGK